MESVLFPSKIKKKVHLTVDAKLAAKSDIIPKRQKPGVCQTFLGTSYAFLIKLPAVVCGRNINVGLFLLPSLPYSLSVGVFLFLFLFPPDFMPFHPGRLGQNPKV